MEGDSRKRCEKRGWYDSCESRMERSRKEKESTSEDQLQSHLGDEKSLLVRYAAQGVGMRGASGYFDSEYAASFPFHFHLILVHLK